MNENYKILAINFAFVLKTPQKFSADFFLSFNGQNLYQKIYK